MEALHPGVEHRAPRGSTSGPWSIRGLRPYSGRAVDDHAAESATEAGPAPDDHPAAHLPTRVLGAAVLVFVAVSAFQVHPVPGAHGRSLGVAIALAVFVSAIAGVILLSDARPGVQLPLLVAGVVGSAVLFAFQPTGDGYFGMFPVVSAAALRLPPRTSAIALAVAVAAVPLAGLAGGDPSIRGSISVDFGVAAFFVLATFARRLRESNERNERLLAELEETRAAQERAAALGERQRLAREMHDVLAHSLSGLVLNLEGAAAPRRPRRRGPAVMEAIERASHLAKAGLEEARGAICDPAGRGAARDPIGWLRSRRSTSATRE